MYFAWTSFWFILILWYKKGNEPLSVQWCYDYLFFFFSFFLRAITEDYLCYFHFIAIHILEEMWWIGNFGEKFVPVSVEKDKHLILSINT